MHINLKKTTGVLAAAGLSLGLIGAGVGASFTDGGTATENISVGTFAITLSSTTSGAVVVNSGNGVRTVTYTAPTIQSSAAGSAPMEFTVTSNGTIPATIHVAVSTSPASPFTDMLGAQSDVTLSSGQHMDYNGGLAWPALTNSNLGASTSIVYTISASA